MTESLSVARTVNCRRCGTRVCTWGDNANLCATCRDVEALQATVRELLTHISEEELCECHDEYGKPRASQCARCKILNKYKVDNVD